jgi:hypothetical protein
VLNVPLIATPESCVQQSNIPWQERGEISSTILPKDPIARGNGVLFTDDEAKTLALKKRRR